jgi:hypothetical protein
MGSKFKDCTRNCGMSCYCDLEDAAEKNFFDTVIKDSNVFIGSKIVNHRKVHLSFSIDDSKLPKSDEKLKQYLLYSLSLSLDEIIRQLRNG